MNSFSMGNITLEPGETKKGKLGTVYLSHGTGVDIPLMAVRGKHAGPVLWLGAAMHGQELSGIQVIWDVMKKGFNVDTLRGTVVGAPLLNPFSFHGRTYYTPEDGYNMNRVFPGDPDGLLTQRLANMVVEQGVKRSDYMIDFHCNVADALVFSIVKGTQDQRVFRESCALAKAFGITQIEMILKYESHRTGTLSEIAGGMGVPNITVELIPWRAIDPLAVQVGVRGVLNVMKSLDMLDGNVEPQQDCQVIPGQLTRMELCAARGGIVVKHARVGEAIRAGQLLGQIVDLYGDPVEDIISPVDGWLLAWPMLYNQAASTGDHVAFLAFMVE